MRLRHSLTSLELRLSTSHILLFALRPTARHGLDLCRALENVLRSYPERAFEVKVCQPRLRRDLVHSQLEPTAGDDTLGTNRLRSAMQSIP